MAPSKQSVTLGNCYLNQIDKTICWEKKGHRSKSRNDYYVYLNDYCPYFKKKDDQEGACSHSCLLSQGCHPTISSSVIPFSSCLQFCPASGSIPMSQFFISGGQSIAASASASVLPMNIQDWFLSGLTGLMSLQSKGLSRVFSNTTIWKHQFFSAQPSFFLIFLRIIAL